MQADTIPDLFTGVQANYGFIIPHSASIASISDTKPYGFEISLNKLHTSFNRWKVYNAYWISGVQAGYFNFQNPDIVGNAFALTIYTEPVIAFSQRIFFTIRTGIGISYHTKFYDEVENPSNQFFATKINFPLYLDLRLKYKLGDHFFITLSGCYNHISNGGFKQPNKGMNFPTVALGAEYYYKNIPVLSHNFSSKLKVPKPGIFGVIQCISTFQVLSKSDTFPEKKVFVYGFHARAAKQLTRFYSLNAGAEIVFDGYIRETIRRAQSELDYKRCALTVGQDFLFGKVFFSQHLGIYLYSPYKARNPVYQKYELALKIRPHIMAGFYLKAHLQVAEMMGLSVSWLISKK
jgi:hypothetical protein